MTSTCMPSVILECAPVTSIGTPVVSYDRAAVGWLDPSWELWAQALSVASRNAALSAVMVEEADTLAISFAAGCFYGIAARWHGPIAINP